LTAEPPAPPPARTGSTLSPLAHNAFLLLWLSSLTSNTGNAIQVVGASWLMTSMTGSAAMVALVQTATSLPFMLFALVGGAAADLHDRRRIMLATQVVMAAISILLAVLVGLHLVSPWTLLGLTLALGVGAAFFNPAFAASTGDSVPRSELPGAVSLNILGFNASRAVGPAIGGAIVALGGSLAAFVAAAGAYLVAVVLVLRRPASAPDERTDKPSMGRAILDGLAYVRQTGPIRVVLLRAVAFTLTGVAAWALMPLIARDLTGGGPSQFGLLLGALGLGAVFGAAASHAIRRRFSQETITSAGGALYGAACLLITLQPGLYATAALLVIGGAGWVQALSGFSVAGQMLSPRWVVGRVTAAVSAVTYGGLAIGSWAWGHVAEVAGLKVAIAASGGAMVLLPLLGLLFPMPRHEGTAKT